MKITKKIFLFGLISVLSFSTLTGCGKDKETTQETKTTNILSEGNTPISERVGLSFDMSSTTKENFTIYGTVEDLENEFYYNSALINKKLVASADTKIIYNATIDHTLTLLALEDNDGKVTINDTEYGFENNNEISVELVAGTYTITSKDTDLCYILVSEINHTIEVELPNGQLIAFNVDDVEVEEGNGYVTYTFFDGSKLKVNTDNTSEILDYGTSGLFTFEEETIEETEETLESEDPVEANSGAEIEQNADEAAPETEENKEAEMPEDNQEEKTN